MKNNFEKYFQNNGIEPTTYTSMYLKPETLGKILVEPLLVEPPKISGSEPKVWRHLLGLVPENTVLDPVGLGRVMDVQGRVIVRDRIHDLAKHCKIRDDSRIIFPQRLAVPQIRLAQDKCPINVRTNHRLDIHTVLQRKDKPTLPMSSVFV